jgi:hypothetical protein
MAKGCNCVGGRPECGACVLTKARIARALPEGLLEWEREISKIVVENRAEAKDYPCTCPTDGNGRCLRCVVTIAMRCYRAGQDHVIATVQDIRARKGLN